MIRLKKEKIRNSSKIPGGTIEHYHAAWYRRENIKKYIFQYIAGKVEHMDAIMPQNIRRFFSLIGEALRTLLCGMVPQGKPIRTFFSVDPLSGETFRCQRAAWYGGIKHIREI